METHMDIHWKRLEMRGGVRGGGHPDQLHIFLFQGNRIK